MAILGGSIIPTSRTFTGKKFVYEGSIAEGFILCFSTTRPTIKKELIEFIKEQIRIKGRIQMGACRDNPPPNSLGKLLQQRGRGTTPQYLSYILPLLEEIKFLTHSFEGKAVWVAFNKDFHRGNK